MTPRLTHPSGCQHCGINQREHMQRWKPPVGWHQWAAPTQAQIKARMQARRAARTPSPATVQDRMRAAHADAYPAPEDPRCATCHRDDCPRYWRIQERLDQQAAARRALLPTAAYDEEPW
ncbi:hypothetical protein [Streptomyces sp. CFMR 7]|uniref:hypothetical protein n=1 Tax=Streptomyces sp. CFMR 7 TaxID=1649184 RepID=UPI0011A88FE2|nr:hypothetical protein [Streptomyces sp. CFMR 7]